MFFPVKVLGVEGEMSRVQNFLIYWLIYFFAYLKFIIISFLVSRGRKISHLSPSVSNTRMLALSFPLRSALSLILLFHLRVFQWVIRNGGFLSAFSLLNNLCWKSFNIFMKKTFSFANKTLLKILPKVKSRLHELLYNVVLGRNNDILCPGNTKIYD